MEPGSRRESRERALSLLYEAESKGISVAAVLGEVPIAPSPFARALVEGVGNHVAELDEIIRRHAVAWDVERMPATDRAILRLATYELAHEVATPAAVVISEAVELAKRYSTGESGRFVNGVLSAIASAVRP